MRATLREQQKQPRRRRLGRLWLGGVMWAAQSLWGCAHSGQGEPAAAVLDEQTTSAVDALAVSLEGELRAWLEAERGALLPKTLAHLNELVSEGRAAHAWVKRHYAGRRSLVFFPDTAWTTAVDVVGGLLVSAQDHALEVVPALDVGRVMALREQLSAPALAQPGGFSRAQREQLERYYLEATARGEAVTVSGLKVRLLGDVALWSDWLTPISVWKGRVEAAARAEAEVALGVADYAYEMRLGYASNTAAFSVFQRVVQPAWMADARLSALFDDVEAHREDDAQSQGEALKKVMWPPHPQYGLLVDARRRYAKFVLEGGWSTQLQTPAQTLKLGKRYPELPAIKARLAYEGYLTPSAPDQAWDDVWDEALSEAILHYQRTRQLREDGLPTPALVNNLNLSVEDRLAKIDVTLQRYRETMVGAFPYYVLVNIPDFHVEVWKDGQRDVRHKIVVGNNGRVRKSYVDPEVVGPDNEEALYAYPNRTPLQFSFMREVIFNPYWNVPERIRVNEIEPKKAKNPGWFERNGFEYVGSKTSERRFIRQKPGPTNALGQVKFIFPNPHNTYLHDTNATWAFKLPIRALSHGCMRVQDPLKLAEYLLRQEDQYKASEIKELLKKEPLEQTAYDLKRPIPVHVEYFITRVDDQGVVHFLSDIYHKERRAIAARTQWIMDHLRPDLEVVDKR
jgi:murein L,D-transpeptidase YcbB/YkuD